MLATASGGLCRASGCTSPSPRKHNSFRLKWSIGLHFSYPGQLYSQSPMSFLICLKFESEATSDFSKDLSGHPIQTFSWLQFFFPPSPLSPFHKRLRGVTCKSHSYFKWCLRMRSGFLGASAIYQRNDLLKCALWAWVCACARDAGSFFFLPCAHECLTICRCKYLQVCNLDFSQALLQSCKKQQESSRILGRKCKKKKIKIFVVVEEWHLSLSLQRDTDMSLFCCLGIYVTQNSDI